VKRCATLRNSCDLGIGLRPLYFSSGSTVAVTPFAAVLLERVGLAFEVFDRMAGLEGG
jgi:hypothetical protein